ncbi:uncharacterized protein N7477_003181 [Penicillium maclennaniae]|uniref:uncharacterized protein n=1 Tax=Penicillium maclennaniae TaxID=1343394 RepID=UPI00254053EA|nr:uncharacterized protein N7477_003181 [Penicillium maclennaniae]KAJ5677548.1 hypothetical protein N7477_003181 [Penicillium maclennaniae]
MRPQSGAALTLLAVVIDTVTGKCNSWQTQVNISICNWQGLRANIIRDTIYIDGGELWLQQGYSDGCVNYVNDGNLQGSIYSLNLTTPFNTSSNFMDVLTNTSIAGGAANNIAPGYVEGAMFANHDGGMLRLTNSTESPPDNTVLGYEAYQYAVLPFPSPSEDIGFLFSGMRASHWGSFTYDGMESNMTADTLISVNLKVMRNEEWTNNTLPSYVPGRAGAEVVWVPVSESGVLVAIRGVVDPVELWRDTGLDPSQTTLNKKISPFFMETVSVYDVDGQKWYLQNTTGEVPPQLTQFCSVLASANDGSSHNVYIYGGYNGYEYDSVPSDDVYILSLPSFKWIKAYSGTTIHGRSGHRCIKVYPNQMLAIGGLHVDPTNCVDGGIIVNFNLNTLVFQSTYDPAEWNEYKVPDILIAEIGGRTSITTENKQGSKIPSWAAAIIAPQPAPAEEPKPTDTEDHKLTDERGAISPRPGPPSHSTGVETTQNSSISAATPVTVESGGDAIYEIQDSSPVELPSPYNISSDFLNAPLQPSSAYSGQSLIPPETPGFNSGTSSIFFTSRWRPLSLPITRPQGLSITPMVGGQGSYFSDKFNSANLLHSRHVSEVSEKSGVLKGRDETRRIPGSNTIHEKE